MKKIIIFASGSGSNAEKIIQHFLHNKQICVAAVFSNKADAGVLQRAERFNIPSIVFNRAEMTDGTLKNILTKFEPDLLVLAGFLLKFPDELVELYAGRILNIHPALLPNYGGKGMYGMHVHQAVLNNKEKFTGITIHQVNEFYDEGAIVFQSSVNIESCQNAEEIAAKVHELEHLHFPQVIEDYINQFP